MGMCGESRRPRRQRRWTSLTCMDSSFLLLPRAGHPWRGYFVMWLTKDALRPRSDAGRGRRSGGEEDAVRPGVFRWGIDSGGAAMRGAAVLRLHRRPAHGRKTQLGPGWIPSKVGKLQGVKRRACSERQTRRMLRRLSCNISRKPAHVEAAARLRVSHAAGMRSRSKRQTHSDRLVEDEAQGALRPSCPADEAINPNRQTGSQRKERSTQTVRRVSSGRSDQLQSLNGCPAGEGLITPTAGLDRGRRTSVNFVVSARAASCGEPGQVRFGSIPSWATGGERIILQSDPCDRDRAPRFLWSETLVKSLTVQSLSPFPAPQKRACKTPQANCRQIVH